MNNINKRTISLQYGSALLGSIILLLLISSLFGWYLYLQTNKDLEKNIQQKNRIQQRYTKKTDELYESRGKLQKLQDKNYQLSKQFKTCKDKAKQLNNQLQLQMQQDKKTTDKLSLCVNEKKELSKNFDQQAAQNKLKENEILTSCKTDISMEVEKLSECKNSIKISLLDIKKKSQQLLHDQNLLQTELKNTQKLQLKIDSINNELSSHKKRLETNSSEAKQLKEQLITNQKIVNKYKKDYLNISQLLKSKQLAADNLAKKVELISSKNTRFSNNNKQLKIKLKTLQGINNKLEKELKKAHLANQTLKSKPKK